MLKRLAIFLVCAATAVAGAKDKDRTATTAWTFTELGTLGGNVSWATGINNAGDVIGWSGVLKGDYTDQDPEFHAFVYANGTMRDLGRAGDSSSAWSINDRGQVAGISFADGVWLRAGAKPLANLGFRGTPYDINGLGMMAGTYDAGGEFRAFTYGNGILSELGTLGGNWSQAEAINDRGVVVGAAGNATNGVQAFIHDGVMRPLFPATHPQEISEALAINNRSQVVGTLHDAGFLWESGRLTMLRSLLTAEQQARWGVLTPTGINDRGWIVGVASTDGVNGIPGGYRRAFLLKPR